MKTALRKIHEHTTKIRIVYRLYVVSFSIFNFTFYSTFGIRVFLRFVFLEHFEPRYLKVFFEKYDLESKERK